MWDHTARTYVFSTLVDYFGPYKEWDGKTRPGDKNIKYEEVLNILADGLSKNFGYKPNPRAIENQIALLLSPGGMLSQNPQAVMKNIVAALESGFVTPSDIKSMGFRLTQNKEDNIRLVAEVEGELVTEHAAD